MRSFREKGPTLKLQRWGSINEVWKWYEDELRASKLILSFMSKSSNDPVNIPQVTQGRDHISAIKPQGIVNIVPRLLRGALYLDMRIFSVVTQPLWSQHGKRAKLITTISDGVEVSMAYARGTWQLSLVRLVRNAMCSAENLPYIGMPEIDGIDRDEIAKRLVDFLLGILHYRVQSQVLCRSSLPEKTILGLSADEDEAVAAWKAMEDDAETLAWIGTMAHFSESMASISARTPWKNHALPRLVLRLAELEKFTPARRWSCSCSRTSTAPFRTRRCARTSTNTSATRGDTVATVPSAGRPAWRLASRPVCSNNGGWTPLP